jgi:hypothetical protein
MRAELNRHTFGDLLHRWHSAVGSREMTVKQMARPLGLSPAGRGRLGHQLRSANGMAIGGYKVMRSRDMCGSVRKWSIARVTVCEAAGDAGRAL